MASDAHLFDTSSNDTPSPESTSSLYPDSDDSTESTQEIYYEVPQEVQATDNPIPEPINSQDPDWLDLGYVEPPLGGDRTRTIKPYNIVQVLVSEDTKCGDGTEHAKVLDIRRLPNGGILLLVSWYYPRKYVAKALKKYPDYLYTKWPRRATFKKMLGCHYDVIPLESVEDIVTGNQLTEFCSDALYGGENFDHRIISSNEHDIDAEYGESNHERERSLLSMLLSEN